MYAGSIFGWLNHIEERVSDLRTTAPVSTDPIAEARTTATQQEVLEVTTLFDALSEFTAYKIVQTDQPDEQAVSEVLDAIQNGHQPRIGDFSKSTRHQVVSSSHFVTCNDHVFVILSAPNHVELLVPFLERIIEAIQGILTSVRDIIKFLDADDTVESESLGQRWKQIGGLLSDFSKLCARLLQQVKKMKQVKTEVDLRVESSVKIGQNLAEKSND